MQSSAAIKHKMILTDPVDKESANYGPRLNFIRPAND